MPHDNCESNDFGCRGGSMYAHSRNNEPNKLKRRLENDSKEDLMTLLHPPVLMIKEEKFEEVDNDTEGAVIKNEPLADDDDFAEDYYSVKQEHTDPGISVNVGNSIGSYNDEYDDEDDLEESNSGDDANYHSLVEETLLKDKKNYVKRQRSENWCEVDKELLKELIKKRVAQIENKNTDTNTNHIKKKAWEDVEKEFNSLCSCKKRTIGQLKSQWTAIKINAKKELSEFRAKSKQTRGGQPPTAASLSANDLGSWLPNEIGTDTNEYDSDVIFAKDEEESLANSENLTKCAIQETSSEGDKSIIREVKQEEEANTKLHQKITPCQKKIAPQKNSIIEEHISTIVQNDMECRKELHLLQIEAERKRIRNLDLEFELIQAKLSFYKKKSFWLQYAVCF